MGKGTESSMQVTLVPHGMDPEYMAHGSWNLTIHHGPTMMRFEDFVEIHLEIRDANGTVTTFDIDPNAPTIETFEKLGESDSPILQALFQGFIHMMID